jgi:hypothetical protein
VRRVARLQARLQDGDEDGQHAGGQLAHELAQRARGRLLQLLLLAGEAGDELPGTDRVRVSVRGTDRARLRVSASMSEGDGQVSMSYLLSSGRMMRSALGFNSS